MVKYKKELSKISREKQQATYWEKSNLNDSKLIRNHGSQKEVVQYFSSAERKINVNSET